MLVTLVILAVAFHFAAKVAERKRHSLEIESKRLSSEEAPQWYGHVNPYSHKERSVKCEHYRYYETERVVITGYGPDFREWFVAREPISKYAKGLESAISGWNFVAGVLPSLRGISVVGAIGISVYLFVVYREIRVAVLVLVGAALGILVLLVVGRLIIDAIRAIVNMLRY